MNDEQARKLGEYISLLRRERNLTIRQLAEKAGVDSGGLTRLEHGSIHYPTPTKLCAIAKALNISFADLFAVAGYSVPEDLPNIEHYLRIKYDCIPPDEAWEICRTVEQIVRIYDTNPAPDEITEGDSEKTAA